MWKSIVLLTALLALATSAPTSHKKIGMSKNGRHFTINWEAQSQRDYKIPDASGQSFENPEKEYHTIYFEAVPQIKSEEGGSQQLLEAEGQIHVFNQAPQHIEENHHPMQFHQMKNIGYGKGHLGIYHGLERYDGQHEAEIQGTHHPVGYQITKQLTVGQPLHHEGRHGNHEEEENQEVMPLSETLLQMHRSQRSKEQHLHHHQTGHQIGEEEKHTDIEQYTIHPLIGVHVIRHQVAHQNLGEGDEHTTVDVQKYHPIAFNLTKDVAQDRIGSQIHHHADDEVHHHIHHGSDETEQHHETSPLSKMLQLRYDSKHPLNELGHHHLEEEEHSHGGEHEMGPMTGIHVLKHQEEGEHHGSEQQHHPFVFHLSKQITQNRGHQAQHHDFGEEVDTQENHPSIDDDQIKVFFVPRKYQTELHGFSGERMQHPTIWPEEEHRSSESDELIHHEYAPLRKHLIQHMLERQLGYRAGHHLDDDQMVELHDHSEPLSHLAPHQLLHGPNKHSVEDSEQILPHVISYPHRVGLHYIRGNFGHRKYGMGHHH